MKNTTPTKCTAATNPDGLYGCGCRECRRLEREIRANDEAEMDGV